MKIKIEKNIPIPSPSRNECKFPFRQMKKGDSFSLRIYPGRKNKQKAKNVHSSAVRFCRANKLNWKFTYRRDKTSLRIWRVK